jgi:hypothetical protein
MTDPSPGEDTGSAPSPRTEPIESTDDGRFRHDGDWNSFQFVPPLTHEDAPLVRARAQELGYEMLFRRADYSMEDVQAQLEDRGPSSFLNMTWLEEDISPKAPAPTAELRMADRLRKLAPVDSLIITDPYLFTSGRKNDSAAYAASVAAMIEPALSPGLQITAIVDLRSSHATVQAAVKAELHARGTDLRISVVDSQDFHDRFWIADRDRGLIIGASLNKIGGRIFFVDELSDADVSAVLDEVDGILDSH